MLTAWAVASGFRSGNRVKSRQLIKQAKKQDMQQSVTVEFNGTP
ncbi:hypothetical protein [Thaumasiovibrio sp. DFM-14]